MHPAFLPEDPEARQKLERIGGELKLLLGAGCHQSSPGAPGCFNNTLCHGNKDD